MSIDDNCNEDKKSFPPWFKIKTESRQWVVRECDILDDGSIPNAVELSRIKSKASKIKELRKEEAVS